MDIIKTDIRDQERSYKVKVSNGAVVFLELEVLKEALNKDLRRSINELLAALERIYKQEFEFASTETTKTQEVGPLFTDPTRVID